MYKSSLAHGDSNHYVGTQDSKLMVDSDEIEEDVLSDADSEEDYEPRFNKAKISEAIVFLPFNSFWKFLIMGLITCLYCFTLYELVFLHSYWNSRPVWMTVIKYICLVAYLIDTSAAIFHIKFKTIAELRNHKPRPMWQIIVDGITLLPFDLIANFTKRSMTEEVYTVLLLVGCIRVYRIYMYFRELTQSVGVNPWRNDLETYGTLLFLAAHTLACIWYLLTDVKHGQLVEAKKVLSLENPSDWYILCLYYVSTILTAVGFGDFYSITMGEHLLTAFTMLIGFTLITGVFCGGITDQLVQTYRCHSIFWNKLSLIKFDLLTCHEPFSNVMIDRVLTYYKRFWVEKGAIKESLILTTLPTQMRNEVYVDMYWNALNGCRLFRDLDVAYKREIAKYMESQCFMEGDIILPQGTLKCKMIYVVQGVIQILSKEDSESPLLAMSAGTCLGEMSLFLSYPSVVEINAASYCELQMLNKGKLMQLIRTHPQIGRKIYKTHIEQLERALEDVTDQHSVKDNSDSIIPKRALKELKMSLRNRDQKESRSAPFSWMTEEEMDELLSEEEKKALIPVEKTLADITLDQYRLSTSVKLETDDVCLRTHWPWVFNPNSNVLLIWNWIIVITVAVACVLIPYYVSFERNQINNAKACFVIIDVLYWFDIYIQLTTGVCISGEFEISIFHIVFQKSQKLQYIIDVVATLPIEIVGSSIFHFQDPLKFNLFRLNRILKIHRVLLMFDRLQNGPLWDNTFVRLAKYTLFLLLGAFWMGTVFYIQACFTDETCPNSWVAKLDNKDYLALKSFYFAVVVISGTGYGDIIPANRNEMLLMMVFYIVSLMLFTYLIADFSSMLILKDMPKINFSERVFAISRFMEVNSIDASIRDRVHEFLMLQWYYKRGYSIMNRKRLFSEAPEMMENWIIIWRRQQFFLGMDLFKGSDMKLIEKLCAIAESYALPPNEIITFAGEVCREFYIVEEGYCESTSNVSQDVNVFGPYTCINESEMLFGIPGFNNVRTLTYCKMLRITKRNFRLLLKQFPEFDETLYKVKSEQVLDGRTVPSVSHARIIPDDKGSYVSERRSWIIHRPSTRQRPNIDYERPFEQLNIYSFIRYILLRRTIYPSGKFFICWEIFRSIFAIMSGLLFPPLAEMRTAYPNLIYIAIILDITAYVDLYIRMHVCYYNERRILVSHPWYTCKHYLTHGFALDLFACFPFELLFGSDGSDTRSHQIIPQNFLRLNRALQLHRISSLASYKEQDILKQHKTVKLFKYLPLTLVLTNILTCVYIWIHSKYAKDESTFTPLPDTWLQKYADGNKDLPFDLKHPVNYYIISCYWITATMFGIGYGDIVPVGTSEMLYSIVVILFGYMVFTYVTVRIASTHAIYNRNLTLYQEHMKHMINFTTRERVTKFLKREIIEHFENVWQKTRGLRPFQMFEKFHLQLKEDAAMFLYEHTLTSNPLFNGVEKSFFRRLVVLVQERYFVAGAEVITLHDFVTNVHFVHNGELGVFDLAGEKRATLRKSNIFGNLERHTGIRLTMPVVASTNVLLLDIATDKFFKLVDDYPIVVARLHGKGSEEIMFESMFESQPRSSPILTTSATRSVVFQSTFLRHVTTLAPVAYLILMGCSYLSCGLIAYHLAFESENPSFWLLVSTITLDALLLFRFFFGFYAPYKNDMGDLINDPHLIKKNYINDLFGIWLDLVSSFPIEAFALAAPRKDWYFVWACLRVIHLFRAFHIVKFFDIRFERLDVNVLLYKASNLALWFFLFGHFTTCVYYMIACPRQKCTPSSWPVKFQYLCHESYYTCALFLIVQAFTTSGLGNVAPGTQQEMVYNIILSIVDTFAIAIFIGGMSAIVANYSYTLVNYDFETNIFKSYLKNNPVSGALSNKVINYVQMMWKEEIGRQIPVFLIKTPPYLIARFNTEVYGKHLYENFIFSACDGDFLRQLIVFFRRYTFYPGNFIVQQGDMDNSLYFLHHGEVEVIAIGENTMELIDVLSHGDTFGLSQGLRRNRPHDYTYRASAVTVVLTLKYENWEHLLRYFPGTRSDILSRIEAAVAPVVHID